MNDFEARIRRLEYDDGEETLRLQKIERRLLQALQGVDMLAQAPYVTQAGPATRSISVAVTGCNGLSLVHESATVDLVDGGGTTIASGSTSGASVAFSGIADGTYQLQTSASRFIGDIRSITVDATHTHFSVGLGPAAGYHCMTGCDVPLSDTLNGSVSILGSALIPTTFTYDSASQGWIGATSKSSLNGSLSSACTNCLSSITGTFYFRLGQANYKMDEFHLVCTNPPDACTGQIADSGGHQPTWPTPITGVAGYSGQTSVSPGTASCPATFGPTFTASHWQVTLSEP